MFNLFILNGKSNDTASGIRAARIIAFALFKYYFILVLYIYQNNSQYNLLK